MYVCVYTMQDSSVNLTLYFVTWSARVFSIERSEASLEDAFSWALKFLSCLKNSFLGARYEMQNFG
jgi:hypothetical protein